MEKHELQERARYYLERITAEEQALSLSRLTAKSRKEIEFLYKIDCGELQKIADQLDNIYRNIS